MSVPMFAVPIFWRLRLTVTVSPGSTKPFAGAMLSAVRLAPADTMVGRAMSTRVVTLALLFARFGSVTLNNTVALLVMNWGVE